MKRRGFRPNNIIPANVGHLFARSYIPSAANCSSIGRVSVSSVSGLTAFGMNLLRKISKSKSSSLAAKQGVASNVAIYEARRSNKIRSSASLAISRRGPIRINVRPLYRTGGISDGVTSTTSTSPSGVSTFSVFITGRGRILPSERMPLIFFISASSTFKPLTRPSSYTPISKYPFCRLPGRSFANAQMASWNLSMLPVDTVRSMR